MNTEPEWKPIGHCDVIMKDSNGNEGPVTAHFKQATRPRPDLLGETGLPLDRAVVRITDDFSRWPEHSHLHFESLGVVLEEDDPQPKNARIRVYGAVGSDSRAMTVRLLRQDIRVEGTSALGTLTFTKAGTVASIHWVDLAGTPQLLHPLHQALRVATHIRIKPGPKKGTRTKFKTVEEWHAALREKVLPKRLLVTASGDQIAGDWLGVGTRTMYRLMRKWGPPTLKDLRRGNF